MDTHDRDRLDALMRRIEHLERALDRGRRPIVKLDSDSPVMPSMDDFNFSDAELRHADPTSGAHQWRAPYRFPHGSTRGLTWDSGCLGADFVNVSFGFLDETGQLLAFIDAVEPADAPGAATGRFVKAQHRFYYRNDHRDGRVRITAAFDVRKARIHDRIHSTMPEDAAVDLLDTQNLRLATYFRSASGDYWHQTGKAVDVVHELTWARAQADQVYDEDRGGVEREVVLTSRESLPAGRLCKFYVGIWSGLSVRARAAGYSIFSEFDVRLTRVRAELV